MWWRLSLPVQTELEESLLWKLNVLGLHRVATQHAPETPEQRTLLAWLPAHEWPEDQRSELISSLIPLAETFGLALAQPVWDDWLMKTGVSAGNSTGSQTLWVRGCSSCRPGLMCLSSMLKGLF